MGCNDKMPMTEAFKGKSDIFFCSVTKPQTTVHLTMLFLIKSNTYLNLYVISVHNILKMYSSWY